MKPEPVPRGTRNTLPVQKWRTCAPHLEILAAIPARRGWAAGRNSVWKGSLGRIGRQKTPMPCKSDYAQRQRDPHRLLRPGDVS